MNGYINALDGIVADVVAPDAAAVDRDGTFPRKAVEALGSAGILGLTVPTAAGGAGGDLRDAAVVIETLSRAHRLRRPLRLRPTGRRRALTGPARRRVAPGPCG